MVLATLLFAAMGVCVKFAAALYGTGEIVFYRGLVGAASLALLCRARGIALRTPVPAMHFWRSLSGVTALSLWFYAIGGLPLPTAMTLNYMSSVWMALFLIGGTVIMGGSRIDGRLVATVLVGFIGVAMVLRPTIERDQLWHGLLGLLSGMLSALAYLQVTALGRVGEPEERVVFYFSLGGVIAGALSTPLTSASGGFHGHTLKGAALLLAVGVLATAAQLLMTRAYATGRVLVNASLQYLGIVYAFIFGALLFDDAVPPLAIAGMLLIVGAGLAATLLRNRSAPPRPGEHEHSSVET
ncbi:DMT family transporter [Rivibacter subsaxonicus]|uniref:S-adenosylmethionine uptake transporter n=1 Tax=Rivibacter subsaxonicus TaxID=457575 RepID=A0A4Q7W1I0_9BURK|nr:DMT family transporter [Rivibacter subsaxonicus]RZU02695.1 S-adenosylmethionine uptake transporter [Rivibacter subsaxonicus]